MSMALRRTYAKVKKNVLYSGSCSKPLALCISMATRNFNDGKSDNNLELSNSTIFIENGFQVQELPLVVRRLKDISVIDDKSVADTPVNPSGDTLNYHLIKTEFNQCSDFREVFSLLTRCTKITPNIALGAMERIYELEKEQISTIVPDSNTHITVAKGAILDKLLKVVMKTEDTQTIINILKTESVFMEPYKHNFSDELLIRVLDNKLTLGQLCEFANFLIKNKNEAKYSDTVDKLWVGFIEKEKEINEVNIAHLFNVVPGLKTSKKIILTLLEEKLANLWYKINVPTMQEILYVFLQEKYLSMDSFAVVGRWLNTNIHAIDEESLLDIITKLTRLKYSDDQVERAVEKYMRLKCTKINTYILIIGILQYCMQFQIRNEHILKACSEYFVSNSNYIPSSFWNSFIHPFGILCFDPPTTLKFWCLIETMLNQKFGNINTKDLCSMILSFVYNGKYPLDLVNKMFASEYFSKVNDSETLNQLHLIDTALSLECSPYIGPLLPKDHWSKPISQDFRVKNIIEKLKNKFVNLAGGERKLSTGVLIPNLCSNDTYMIDVMFHPAGLGSSIYNWKSKAVRNENIAILIHMPDHYCSDNEHLIGPQVMRKKHLRILGMKVASLKYSLLSQFYTSNNISGLEKYLEDAIKNAEPCL